MRRRSREAFLWDVADSCEAIVGFDAGRDLADYLGDRMLHRAVERELSIVGEAISQMTRSFPETRTIVGPVGQIVGFRNRLIHEYAEVSGEIVWAIVQDHVSPLLARVRASLDDDDTASAPPE